MSAASGAVLSNSVLNLSALREFGRKELTDLLDAIPVNISSAFEMAPLIFIERRARKLLSWTQDLLDHLD